MAAPQQQLPAQPQCLTSLYPYVLGTFSIVLRVKAASDAAMAKTFDHRVHDFILDLCAGPKCLESGACPAPFNAFSHAKVISRKSIPYPSMRLCLTLAQNRIPINENSTNSVPNESQSPRVRAGIPHAMRRRCRIACTCQTCQFRRAKHACARMHAHAACHRTRAGHDCA